LESALIGTVSRPIHLAVAVQIAHFNFCSIHSAHGQNTSNGGGVDRSCLDGGGIVGDGLTGKFCPFHGESRIVSDFPGSATVSVACVGVSPTQRYAADKFTRSMAIRACR
jgi:hypothetical protein